MDTAFAVLMGFAFIIMFFAARVFALKAQDRVIRLEMRLRMKEVLPASMHARIKDFTPGQLVALRFACDAELPALAETVLRDNIQDRKQIKLMVKEWQGDYSASVGSRFRVHGTKVRFKVRFVGSGFASCWRLVIVASCALQVVLARSTSQPRTTALRFGAVVTGLGPAIRDAVVVIEGDRIVRVGSGDRLVPAGAEVIDLRPLTAIPGLIDAHTHMTYYWDPASGTQPLRQPRREPAQTVELSAANARRTLEAGVTTARDLGASGGTDYSMRDLINTGKMIGPRMFVSGQGISAGRAGGPGAGAMPALVEARVKAGSDWIKVYASRGSFQSVDTTQTLTFDEMKAIVDAAHALGRPVAIHSYGASGREGRRARRRRLRRTRDRAGR